MASQPLGACVLLLNPQSEVLVGKRKNGYRPGLYGLPGGRIEFGEPVLDTAIREVREETGLQVPNLKYQGAVRETQDERDFIHFVFVGKHITDQPQLVEPDKCEGWEWHSLENCLTLPLLPGHKAAIEMHLNHTTLADLT
jgi:8-oxo-dGTP diphosphatase